MGRLDRIPFFARPKGAARQMARVQMQARMKWPGMGIKLDGALQISSDASVFHARRGEEAVVVKKFWDRGRRRTLIGDTVRGLRHFTRLDPDPRFSVNKYIASSGSLGLLIVSFEPGKCLKALLEEDTADRAGILHQCCAWQGWANQGKIVHSPLPERQFRSEINGVIEAFASHPDAKLVGQLGSVVLKLLADIGERPAARSRGHPDFAPRNLIMRPDGGLAAVDIHRRGRFYSARQTANFLVSKDFANPQSFGPLLYGLDQQEMLTFLAYGSVPEEETRLVLPFFIGLTFLLLYPKNGKRPLIMRRRRQRIRAFIADAAEERSILP